MGKVPVLSEGSPQEDPPYAPEPITTTLSRENMWLK